MGTYPFCRTKEAIQRMLDGDVIQNTMTSDYFKVEHLKFYISSDCIHWEEFTRPMETFPPYVEWRSVHNLHYYADLKRPPNNEPMWFLASDGEVLIEDHPKTDKTKKRWFLNQPIRKGHVT